MLATRDRKNRNALAAAISRKRFLIQMKFTPFGSPILAVFRGSLPILIATIIVGGICVFGEPLYETNDDSFVAMVAGGFGAAVKPDPHLVWTHYPHYFYGLLLVALNRFIGPNAHGWVTVFAIWFSLVLVLQAALGARSLFIRISVPLVYIGAVFLTALLSADYTITTAVLFGAAIASWFVSAGGGRPITWVRWAAILFTLILSYLIRSEAFIMSVIIVMPALVFLSCRKDSIRRSARLLTLSLGLIVVLGSSEWLAYSNSPKWREVPAYMNCLNQIVAYHRVPWLPEAPEYRQVGWSYNDYEMFQFWYTRDPIYNLAKLQFLVKKLAIPSTATILVQIRDWFCFPFTSWLLILPLAAQVAIGLTLIKHRGWLAILLIFGELLAIAGAAATGREPQDYVWTAASAVTLTALCALIILTPASQDSFKTIWVTSATLLGLASAVLVCGNHLTDCRNAAAYRDWIKQNSVYFRGKVAVWDLGLIWEWLVTPTHIYPPFPDLKVASIDSISCMPVETAMLKSLQIDDLAKDLCTDPRMTLICESPLPDNLAEFCKQHYGITPVFKQAATFWDARNENQLGVYVLDQATPRND